MAGIALLLMVSMLYVLAPGKYTYKLIVDGKWIRDPGNELWEENEYNTGNSVLWITR